MSFWKPVIDARSRTQWRKSCLYRHRKYFSTKSNSSNCRTIWPWPWPCSWQYRKRFIKLPISNVELVITAKLVYARAHNHENQLELIDHVAALFIQEPEAFKLLIIDSIIGKVQPCIKIGPEWQKFSVSFGSIYGVAIWRKSVESIKHCFEWTSVAVENWLTDNKNLHWCSVDCRNWGKFLNFS